MTATTATRTARIVGKVEYRTGDGPRVVIRPGPLEVEVGPTDVTLAWVDGETHGSAAIPLAEFQRFVAEGAIRFDEAAR
jgi:hypothetical protein